jgi:hypothetical protein
MVNQSVYFFVSDILSKLKTLDNKTKITASFDPEIYFVTSPAKTQELKNRDAPRKADPAGEDFFWTSH